MLLENPAFKKLRVLFSVLKNLEKHLKKLQKYVEQEKFILVLSLEKELNPLLQELYSYSGEELNLLQRNNLSRSCIQLIGKIKLEFGPSLYQAIKEEGKLPKVRRIAFIRDLISKVLTAEKIVEDSMQDLNWEGKMKKKAKKIARPQLSFQIKGCYHFTQIELMVSVLSAGLKSIKELYAGYGVNPWEQDKNIGVLPNFQGHSHISVFDPYSYGRLYLAFEKHGLLEKYHDFCQIPSIPPRGRPVSKSTITMTEWELAFDELKDINLGKYSKENIKILLGDREFISAQEYNGGKRQFVSNRYGYFGRLEFGVSFRISTKFDLVELFAGDFCLLIDDTGHFFPMHDDTYPYELILTKSITSKNIIGIVMRDNFKYKNELLELCKFAGVPAYNQTGKLIWPLD